MDRDWWQARGRYLAGLVLLAFFGLQAFVRGVRVPLLGWIDLAIHEAGHLFAIVLPDLLTAAAGSGFQVFVPLFLAGVFWFKERDALGTAVGLGWAGTSLQDASVYVADAPFQRLQLIGGEHDWAFVLGRLGRLDLADDLARAVWVGGLLVWLLAVGLCLAGPRVRSPGAHTNLPSAAAHRPRPDAGGTPRGAGRPDDPADADGGVAGVVDPRGSGDAPRARVVW
jgi:hypothetical protein